jgi:hypothetical protein
MDFFIGKYRIQRSTIKIIDEERSSSYSTMNKITFIEQEERRKKQHKNQGLYQIEFDQYNRFLAHASIGSIACHFSVTVRIDERDAQ